jgi:carbon storage regulator
MLVFKRKKGDTVVIGGGITVTVLSVARGVVRIGFEAPREVRVDRGEVAKRIEEEKRDWGR